MEPPAITRHRRPCLVPVYLIALIAAVLLAVGWVFYKSATTTVVFLVRPAEKALGAIDDPPLSAEGEARAERLAHMFGAQTNAGRRIDAIYESEDRRSQQTAAPLVERLHLAPVVFRSTEARAIAARAVNEHTGGTVLVIASGNALPEMVQDLTGVPVAGVSDEVDLMYVVSVPSIGRAHLAAFRL